VIGKSLGGGSEGVLGRQLGPGHGVRGEGEGSEHAGVKGTNDTGAGVIGESKNTGYDVVGDGTGNGAGVLGRNAGGPGVEARDNRYGGKFDGSRAQLLLVPKGTTGRPISGTHTKGELYVDSAATLFVCTKSGTPGTWRKATTTAV
jgi:hypothetical protein